MQLLLIKSTNFDKHVLHGRLQNKLFMIISTAAMIYINYIIKFAKKPVCIAKSNLARS